MALRWHVWVGLLALLGYVVSHLGQRLDLHKTLHQHNNHACILIDGSTGNEDLQLANDHILFLSSDNKQIFPRTPFSATVAARAPAIEDGAIYYIDLRLPLEQQRITKLRMNRSYPSSVEPDFHPHGMSVSANGKYLYVVSHGRTGEAVFVFQIYYNQQAQPNLLDFIYVIHDPLFTGTNNDLTCMLRDLRVASDHPHVDNFEHTLYITSWTGSSLDQAGWMFAEVLSGQPWGFITRCIVTKHSNSTDQQAIYTHQCEKIIDKLAGPNGVVVTNDNQTLAVALTSTRQLQFYHINDLYNKLSHVQSYHTIQLDMAVDNLNIDPISGDIIVAGHPIVWQFVQHNHAPHAHHSPNQVDRIAYLGNHRYANVSSNVLTDAGELLSASSAAEQHNQYLYVGGVTSKGVLACQLQ